MGKGLGRFAQHGSILLYGGVRSKMLLHQIIELPNDPDIDIFCCC
ncbi:MAG: hypothetical protein ACI9CP_000958 [Cryomorphaceae bacterium]